MDSFKTIVFTLVWTFSLLIIYMIANTMVFGHVDPMMRDLAYQSRDNITGGTVNYETYTSQIDVLNIYFNITMMIMIAIPYIYLFVRLMLKREQTAAAPPGYYPGAGF